MSKERFQLVIDRNKDKDIIRKFGKRDKRYDLTARELKKYLKPGERVCEYIFKPYKCKIITGADSLNVDVDGMIVGSVKKGSVSHIKRLLSDSRARCMVDLGGGKYKEYDLDGEGNLKIVSGSTGLWGHLTIKTGLF